MKRFLFLFSILFALSNVAVANEDVSFVSDNLLLKGTLSLPKATPKAAIVLVCGSGKQSRDEDVLGFPVFKTLAEHLNDQGYAVLRYDKRGCFLSEGADIPATGEDYTKDATAAVGYLHTRKELSNLPIGILGHSEGGTSAAKLASDKTTVSFAISMAGPAVDGYHLLLEQIEWANRFRLNADEEQIEKKLNQQRAVMDAAISGDDETVKALIESFVREEASQTSQPISEEYIATIVEQLTNTMISPWMRHFLTHNAAVDWANSEVPTLTIFGEKDTQVSVRQNRPPMEQAAKKSGNKHFTIVEIKGANHLFQEANTGDVSEYGSLPKAFAPDFLKTLDEWLDRVV